MSDSLFLEVGQDKEFESSVNDYVELPRTTIKEGDNYHRIIKPIAKTRSIFWVTREKNPDTKEIENKIKVALVGKDSIFDRFAIIEKKIKQELGEKDPYLVFKPKVKYPYLIFDLSNPKKEVSVCDYPYQVFKNITEMQNKPTQNGEKLANGLIFMYPIIVSKTVDKGKKKQFGTGYTAQPDFSNPKARFWAGRVPINWINFNTKEINDQMNKVVNGKLLWSYVWDEDEIEAIQSFFKSGIKIDEIYKPKTDDEILEKFNQFPIDINSVDMNGRPFFNKPELFMEKLNEYNIKFLESKNSYVQITAGEDGNSTEVINEDQLSDEIIPANEISVKENTPIDLTDQLKSNEEVSSDLFSDDNSISNDLDFLNDEPKSNETSDDDDDLPF